MAFIQCECGSKIELSPSAMRVTCPGCGQRFTVPQIDDEPASEQTSDQSDSTLGSSVREHSTPAPVSAASYRLATNFQERLAAGSPQVSSTMMPDLPVVTQFEDHYAHSVLAVGMFTGHATSHATSPAAGAMAGSGVPVGQSGAVGQGSSAAFFGGMAAGLGVLPLAAGSSSGSAVATPLGDRSTRKSRRRDKTAPSEAADVQLAPGQTLLERYEVLRKIGQGGMSSVYEACDHIRGEQVALKILLPHLAAKPRLQERFLQEGRVSSNFSHPNIARVYDLHQTDSLILLSMELLHGSTLRHDMHRRKTQGQSYRPAEVVAILRQVCEALTVVHASGIVHRDLKPENLWLGLDGTVKVMDFGIARDAVRGAHTTGPRGSGTPYYIAPEQLSASPTLDHRADQYSLAIIAHELLTGELPQGAVTPPHIKYPHIPKKLSQSIIKALSADPGQRFSDIRQFQAALKFDRRMPLVAKLAIATAAIGALASGGYAFERWGLPLLETKVSPVWAELAPKEVSEGSPLSFSVRHPDCFLSGKSLQYKLLSDAPVGATIDAQSGQFNWTPTEVQGPKTYNFNVMAIVEENGRPPAISERPVEITVNEVFNAPLLDTPEAVTVRENALFEQKIEASDPNQPPVGLVYELVDPPAGMSIDARSGTVKWTPREDAGGTHPSVPVRVSLAGDEHREIATVRKLNLHVEESIDKLTFISGDRLSAEVGQPLSFRVTTRDPNTPTLNTYYRLKGGDRLGMTIEPRTGLIEWTPTEDASAKTFDLTVEACWDGAGKTEVVGSQAIKATVAQYTPPKEEPAKSEPEPAATAPVAPSPAPSTSVATSGLGSGGLGSGGLGGQQAGTCPTNGGGNNGGIGGGAGGNNGGRNNGGNQGGSCPSGNGNGGGNGLGNGLGIGLGNGQPGGIIADIVTAAVNAHHQKHAGQNANANGAAVTGSVPNSLPTNALPTNKLPTNKLPVGGLPIGALPIHNLPLNKLPNNNNNNNNNKNANRLPINQLPLNNFPVHRQTTVAPNQSQGNSNNQAGRHNAAANQLKQKIEQELFKAQQGSGQSLRSMFKR
ncbi:MAG: protein kinase domain-containing protein [Aureliella sp.]